MSVLKFKWNGTSSDSFGIEVLRLPAGFIAAQRFTEVVVPGRSGALHITEDAMDEQLLQIDCYLPYDQGRNVATMQNIAKWLRGSGTLEMSSSMETSQYMFVYKGRVANGMTMSHVVPGFNDNVFSVQFYVEPYRYCSDWAVRHDMSTTMTFSSVNNYANWEPIYTMHTKTSPATGTGVVKVKKGSTVLATLTGTNLGADKEIVIDVPNKVITCEGEIITDKFTGEWIEVHAESYAAGDVLSFDVSDGDAYFITTGSNKSVVQWNKRCY